MKKPGATDFLAHRGWLAFTPLSFREAVLARLKLCEFRSGDAVYRVGDRPGGLWAIVNGAVEIEIPPPGTAPHLVHFAASGYWFGEWPLIHNKPRRVTVVATRPSILATLPLADCRAILKADPSSWRWIAVLSSMTSDLSAGVVADLLLRDPVKRTAALLLRLAGVRSAMFGSAEPSPIYLSQEKLGQLVNLSRNSIRPILHAFVKQRCIEVSYGSILIIDSKGLSATISR